MSRYKSAIFDLDGTLLNTLPDLMNSVNYVLKKNNQPIRTYDEVRRFVGNGISVFYLNAYDIKSKG